MSPIEYVYMFAGVFSVFLSAFGYSHSALSKRIDKLSSDIQTRKTDADLRVLISDKLEPYRVEMSSITKQIDTISHQYQELDRKLDSILACIKHTS